MINERMKKFEKFGNELPFAKVYYREDWDCIYFDVHGKQFGLMSKEASQEAFITLKGNPEVNEILRETSEDIIPGYYANKKHWNSIFLKTTDITDEEIEKMIENSYQLVWEKFPARVRKELLASQ
ncbi:MULTISPECIES: MmcQ/YjbR family DNA-binding protein [Vagococcus]|uniref:MmcQ/YjbR family DNA-binding protein n=1 Tax=Vagococcus fluvialis bH819 TaxID=1255619 RepID=A0A1X6WQQ3_9ENTE|nr:MULTISPECIES: MmcQ/YjbR family DNA-binding protein [Vagococcus]SLM86671.1 Protein of unknown function DUF419 [Vagococcus fluvialis bH819]HCM90879.1 hypothetical protein [Vagococcus sp.]